MRVKCDDNGFPIYQCGFFFHFLYNLPVAGMHSIKCTDGYDRITEGREIICILVYFHVMQNKCSMFNIPLLNTELF